jgi:hypothetical protein
MQAQFINLRLKSFQWYNGCFNPMNFHPLLLPYRNFNSQNGSPLGSVWVHSLTLSYTPKRMKCDSQTSLLARTFASPCFSHEPKGRLATCGLIPSHFLTFHGMWMWVLGCTLGPHPWFCLVHNQARVMTLKGTPNPLKRTQTKSPSKDRDSKPTLDILSLKETPLA